MKSVILFVLFVALCSAEDTVKWAGTTEGGATFAFPTFTTDTPAVCSATTTQAPYVYFNVTFTTAGVREVAALAEKDYKSSIRIFVYLGTFDPTAPCTNIQGAALTQQTGLSGGPVIDDYVYFTAATYQFIVTSTSTGGLFAVNIFPSIAAGQLTNDGSVWWSFPSIDSDGDCTSGSYYPTPVGWFSWTQPTTGYFDILASFANVTDDDFEATAVLFQGTPSAGGLIQDPCNDTATGATYISGFNGDSRGALIAYASLTAGVNYTVAFSGDEGETAYWGVQVNPTRLRFFHTTSYTQPSRSFDPTDPTSVCTASSNDDSSWDTTLFLTEERAYLLDTSTVPPPFTYVDTFSFLYEGYNLGTDAFPPSACPLGASLVSLGDTGDVTPVFALTNPGVNYTVVVSTYSGGQVSSPATAAYLLYLFTGTPIGALPPSTTGLPTTTGDSGTPTGSGTITGTPTGSGTITGTPTGSGTITGTPTGGSGTTSTTGNQPVSTSTSGASSVVVGFVAVVAIFASLL